MASENGNKNKKKKIKLTKNGVTTIVALVAAAAIGGGVYTNQSNNAAVDTNPPTAYFEEYTEEENTSSQTDANTDSVSQTDAEASETYDVTDYVDMYEGETLVFRSHSQLKDHYEKHGIEMGFTSEEEYERAADAVVHNPKALHKLEAEDGDDVFYVEETNEFVIVSGKGFIRTYFNPSQGIKYFNRQ